MLASGRPTIPEKKAWPGSRDPFQNFTPLKFLWNAEDRIVKFCAGVDVRTVSLAMMTNYLPGGRG